MSEKFSKRKAVAVLGADALSSVAYGSEALVVSLIALSSGALFFSLPVALGVIVLLALVVISYRQVIDACPEQGSAWTLAKENLGVYPALVSAAALLLEYILAIAVSVISATAVLEAIFPVLGEYEGLISLVLLTGLTMGSFRELRSSSFWFSLPGWFFILMLIALVAGGLAQIGLSSLLSSARISWDLVWGRLENQAGVGFPLFPVLQAVGLGAAAFTGIENISNAASLFDQPANRNAKAALTRTALILGALFCGVLILIQTWGVVPQPSETALSALAETVFGTGPLWFVFLISVFLILLVAAGAAYSRWPVLASVIARDRYLPRQLTSLGDRVLFSNSLVGLSIGAGVLIFLFDGDLVPLVALYVAATFLSMGITQLSMASRFSRSDKPGWLGPFVFQSFAALVSFSLLLALLVAEFFLGVWALLIFIPSIAIVLTRIRRHYVSVERELTLTGLEPPPALEKMRHTVIIPISGVHRGILAAVRYGVSISDDVRACYVELDRETTRRVQEEWSRWAPEIPFVVLKPERRSVVSSLIQYIADVERITRNELTTVIIPEFVPTRWWHRLLHNQTAFLIRASLMFKSGKVVTSVRYHLRDS